MKGELQLEHVRALTGAQPEVPLNRPRLVVSLTSADPSGVFSATQASVLNQRWLAFALWFCAPATKAHSISMCLIARARMEEMTKLAISKTTYFCVGKVNPF
jgi:hypothetical protein